MTTGLLPCRLGGHNSCGISQLIALLSLVFPHLPPTPWRWQSPA